MHAEQAHEHTDPEGTGTQPDPYLRIADGAEQERARVLCLARRWGWSVCWRDAPTGR